MRSNNWSGNDIQRNLNIKKLVDLLLMLNKNGLKIWKNYSITKVIILFYFKIIENLNFVENKFIFKKKIQKNGEFFSYNFNF